MIFAVIPIPAWAFVPGVILWDGYEMLTNRAVRISFSFYKLSGSDEILADNNRFRWPSGRDNGWGRFLLVSKSRHTSLVWPRKIHSGGLVLWDHHVWWASGSGDRERASILLCKTMPRPKPLWLKPKLTRQTLTSPRLVLLL